jgi:hypothetical protein
MMRVQLLTSCVFVAVLAAGGAAALLGFGISAVAFILLPPLAIGLCCYLGRRSAEVLAVALILTALLSAIGILVLSKVHFHPGYRPGGDMALEIILWLTLALMGVTSLGALGGVMFAWMSKGSRTVGQTKKSCSLLAGWLAPLVAGLIVLMAIAALTATMFFGTLD